MLIQYIMKEKQICTTLNNISLEFGHSNELYDKINKKYNRRAKIISSTVYSPIPHINQHMIEDRLENNSDKFTQELNETETDLSIITINGKDKFRCDKELGVHVYDEIIQVWLNNPNSLVDVDEIIELVKGEMKYCEEEL